MRHNASEMQRRVGLPLIPMVKANAYGVGAAGVVRALEPLDPMAYGVATIAEGEALRELGIVRPLIVFTPVLAAEHARARTAGLTLALGDSESIRSWGLSGGQYHLAIDTGMSRAGVDWRDVASVRDAVRACPPQGAFTHFHSAESDDGSARAQVERFFAALAEIGTPIAILHGDNSAAAALAVEASGRWSAIRPGVFLYGVGRELGINPQPVVSLRARVVDLRWIEPGDSVSYGATYHARRKSRIATVAVGYGDGYPRSLSNRATATLNGNPISQRGLVTMDMTMFDVTEVACSIGDVVTLVGGDGGEALTVEGVARTADMSPYELLTGLSERLERRFDA